MDRNANDWYPFSLVWDYSFIAFCVALARRQLELIIFPVLHYAGR